LLIAAVVLADQPITADTTDNEAPRSNSLVQKECLKS